MIRERDVSRLDGRNRGRHFGTRGHVDRQPCAHDGRSKARRERLVGAKEIVGQDDAPRGDCLRIGEVGGPLRHVIGGRGQAECRRQGQRLTAQCPLDGEALGLPVESVAHLELRRVQIDWREAHARSRRSSSLRRSA